MTRSFVVEGISCTWLQYKDALSFHDDVSPTCETASTFINLGISEIVYNVNTDSNAKQHYVALQSGNIYTVPDYLFKRCRKLL
jgi:hypothetical protein